MPAWGGFLTAELMLIYVKPSDEVIEALLNCCLNCMLHDADMKLFRSRLHSTHYIHQLLPLLKFMPMKWHTSHCSFALRCCHYNLYKHSFLLRCTSDGQITCLCCCSCFYSLFHVVFCVLRFTAFNVTYIFT